MQLLTPQEAQALWPLMTVDDVVGAAFLPTDGQANPSDITQALAKGARMAGVTLREEVAVTGFELELGRVRAVADRPGPDRLREGRALRRAVDAGAGGHWPGSTCRWSRCSTSTSSPSRSRA